jgi:hypothetical protein
MLEKQGDFAESAESMKSLGKDGPESRVSGEKHLWRGKKVSAAP